MSILTWTTEISDVYLGTSKLKEVYVWDTKVFPTMKLTLLAEVIYTDASPSPPSSWFFIYQWDYIAYDKVLYEVKNYKSNYFTQFMFNNWYSDRKIIDIWYSNDYYTFLSEWTSWKPYVNGLVNFPYWGSRATATWEFRAYWVL